MVATRELTMGEVQRVFHKLRSVALENFHEHFKGIFGEHGQVPDLWLARYPSIRAGDDLCLSVGFALLLRAWPDLWNGLKTILTPA